MGQFKTCDSTLPCWMQALWLPTVPNMLEDILHLCPIVKDLVRKVSVDWVLKGLQSLNLTLWLLSVMCCSDRGSLPFC